MEKIYRFLELIKTYMFLKGFKISQLFSSQVSITFASEDIGILGDALKKKLVIHTTPTLVSIQPFLKAHLHKLFGYNWPYK
jgi:hypothetical protein